MYEKRLYGSWILVSFIQNAKEVDLKWVPIRVEREIHEMNKNSKYHELFQKTEEKQWKAMRKDRDAEDSDRSAIEGEQNAHWPCDQLLANGRWRGEHIRDKEREDVMILPW